MSYETAQRVGGRGAVADAYFFYQAQRVVSEALHWRFTSADRGFRIAIPEYPLGADFYPDAGVQRSSIEGTNETQAAELKVTVAHDNPVAEQWKQQQPEWPIWLRLYRVQLATGRAIVAYRGRVVNGEFSDEVCELTVSSLKSAFQRRLPVKTYQLSCNNQLYDRFCALNQADWTTNATITSIDDRVLTVTWNFGAPSTAVTSFSSGFFTAGVIAHPTGTDSGGREMVALHVENGDGTALLTMLQRNSWLSVGDSIDVSAGCDRLHNTCSGKFANLQHFMGMPFIPAVNIYDDGVA